MKVTFIGHASILVEAGGVSVLSDPWWGSPCFGAQWWHYPAPATSVVYENPPDYIYVSHGHHDHLHLGTLAKFDRSIKMLVSNRLDLAAGISKLGFEVIEVDPNEPISLSSELSGWLWPTYGGDSLLALRDSSQVCINLNDALHSAPRDVQDQHLTLLRQRFPNPQYVFCGYGTASHFPNCYRIPGKDDAATAARRQSHFNAQWSYIIAALKPKFAFPFAASVVLLEDDLVGINEVVHNAERPVETFRAIHGETETQLIDPAPGFVIENDRVIDERLFEPLRIEEIKARDPGAVARANTYETLSVDRVAALAGLLKQNIEICRSYLLEYRGDYQFLVEFRGSDAGLAISKKSEEIVVEPVEAVGESRSGFDVRYRTRAAYLGRSLLERYGGEILFVGSGGVFEYKERKKADMNLHRELSVMLVKHAQAPRSRFGDNPSWLFHVKTFIKMLLRRQNDDLYDLKRFVVYKGAG